MRIRTLLMVPVASVLVYACGGSDTTPAKKGEVVGGYEDVVLAGDLSDETLTSFTSALEQKAPETNAAKAPTLDEPADGAEVPASPIPTFRWHFGPKTSRNERARPRGSLASSGAPWKWWNSEGVAENPRSFVSPLRELMGGIRAAEAHGDPYTGNATFLVFKTGSNPKLLRVFTTEVELTPSAEAMQRLVSAGGPVTLTLIGVEMDQDRVAAGGGPFAGSSTTFTVKP